MSNVILILGLMTVFAGLALAVASVGVLSTERTGVSKSLAAIEAISSLPDSTRAELEPSFTERILAPLKARLVAFGRHFTPTERIERLQRRMELAGMPTGWSVDRILATKSLGLFGLGGGLLLLFLANGRPLWAIVFGAGGAALGWYLPEIILHQKAYNRSEQIQKDLPDTLDLLTISVEAGMGFDSALRNVARNSSGPVAEEFFRVLQEMQLGVGRMDALRALNDRTDVEDLRIFVNAMAQADAFGIPIAQVLRSQAKEMRVRRSQRAEEKAMKIPVKMTFPTILFILPTLMVIVIGPAVVSIVNNFINVI